VAISISAYADAGGATRAEADAQGGVPSMIATLAQTIGTFAVLVFVIATLAFVAYALVRPFTHAHYRHPSERLWRPLD
jgi:hypothetical protein